MKSPGHQQWPDHQVKESHLDGTARVAVGGEVVAESNDVIRVDEDRNPVRLYFPRDSISSSRLEPSSTTSRCPFKGTASYFNLKLPDTTLKDAVWCYEEPFEEHRDLKGRLAFYNEKFANMDIRTQGASTRS